MQIEFILVSATSTVVILIALAVLFQVVAVSVIECIYKDRSKPQTRNISGGTKESSDIGLNNKGCEVSDLDLHQSVKTLLKREHGTDKFIVVLCTDDGESYESYISGDLLDVEICYMIQYLKDRRGKIFPHND